MPESTASRSGGVWVLLEQTDGVLESVSLEVLGKAKELAGRIGAKVTGILLGNGVGNLAEEAARRGADTVVLADSPLLKEYAAESHIEIISQLVKKRDPGILLLGATHNGVDLAGRLAVRLGAGLMAHVVELEIEDATGALLGSVPGFGGNILAVCKCREVKPQMATVRPGIFKALEPDEASKGAVERLPVSPDTVSGRCRVVERSVGEVADITQADRVVVAGLGTAGDLSSPRRLAQILGATLAVSRPLADKGMAPKDIVVGSTGRSLSSKLALVLGVSGAAHFTSGINAVETVIAINKDREALIFNHADYCVVGDLTKILPPLISALEIAGGQA